MTPGHSRILTMEPVLPPVSAPLPTALLDMQMSQMGGGLRTEHQWRTFLAEAGFEVWRFLPWNSNQTVIEDWVIESWQIFECVTDSETLGTCIPSLTCCSKNPIFVLARAAPLIS
jgi:hypothetical protein